MLIRHIPQGDPAALRAGDTFQVQPDGTVYEAQADAHPAPGPVHGIIVMSPALRGPFSTVVLVWTDQHDEPLILPAAPGAILPVCMPRRTIVPCLLCREPQDTAYDLAHCDGVRAVICDTCDRRTAVLVARSRPVRRRLPRTSAQLTRGTGRSTNEDR